ncbi:DUF5818 domain-containing protein [Sphingobium sp. B1D7B]|uniref:DUF5818 domain-containing protein n=1 Tax=Sphingobium sp. B1D7B TaxID=2940578 RepID=UPI0022245ED6|nr:DUF5818 domain-containing protein [Sphingobium sp. B1D7B]
MSRNSKYALAGLVLQDGVKVILRVDDGGEWCLAPERSFSYYLGRRVRVSGTREGFDLLSVISIEPI